MAETRSNDDDDHPDTVTPDPGTSGDGRAALRTTSLVVLAVAGGTTLALQPRWAGSAAPWWIMSGCYALLGAWAARSLWQRGVLFERLRLRAGDTSVGIVLGLALAAAGYAAERMLAPSGSKGALWLDRVRAAAGDYQTESSLIFALIVVAAMEELVWRGMVQDHLAAWRPRRAPLYCGLAFALATAPSAWLLANEAGPNPWLVLAGLGTGLTWSYARTVLPRLFPLMISHVVFTYFMAAPLPHWF